MDLSQFNCSFINVWLRIYQSLTVDLSEFLFIYQRSTVNKFNSGFIRVQLDLSEFNCEHIYLWIYQSLTVDLSEFNFEHIYLRIYLV